MDANHTILRVTDYGADPAGEQDSTQAVQAVLEAARNTSGPVTLLFPKGEYHFYKDFAPKRLYHTSNTDSCSHPEKTIAILIEDQEDLTLDGDGSLFLMHGNLMALAVVRSKRIVLRDFSWDFAVPTVSEMTVTGFGKKGLSHYTDFYIAGAFPFTISGGRSVLWTGGESLRGTGPYWTQKNQHNGWSVVGYDPNTGISRRYSILQGPFARARKIERLAPNRMRVTYFGKRPEIQKTGMVYELCASKTRETAGAFNWESEDLLIEKVNVHYMHGFGWLTQMCRDVTYRDCRFMPRSGTGKFTTSFADLIHASGVAGTMTVENCVFGHAHDDPINLHGTFTRVEKRLDARTLMLRYVHKQQGGFPQFHTGDEVIFYARDTLAPLCGKEETYRVVKAIHPGEGGNSLKTMTVTFDRDLPEEIMDKIGSEPKYVAENVTFTANVVIRNNFFTTIPTRGILCTQRKKVLIENNVFQNMAMASIFLSNDSNEWYESGPIRDLTIRGNTFYIRPAGQTEWKYKPAIYIHPEVKGGSSKLSADTPVHRNLTIEENTFYMGHDGVVRAEGVDGLSFRRNRVLRDAPDIRLHISPETCALKSGERVSLQTQADGRCNQANEDLLFSFEACSHVTLMENTYDGGLKAGVALVRTPRESVDCRDALSFDADVPASAPVGTIAYRSTDEAVVSVDDWGQMTAVGPGGAYVYAQTMWNGISVQSNLVPVSVDGADLPPAREPESAVHDARMVIPSLVFDTAGSAEKSIVVTTAPDCELGSVEIRLSADETAGALTLCTGDERALLARTQERTLSVNATLSPGLNSFYARVTARDGQTVSERAVHIIRI